MNKILVMDDSFFLNLLAANTITLLCLNRSSHLLIVNLLYVIKSTGVTSECAISSPVTYKALLLWAVDWTSIRNYLEL